MIMTGGPGAFIFGAEEEQELQEVIRSRHLFRYGSEDDPNFLHKVMSFEEEMRNYTGAKYALATTSGTASLMCCLAALGVGAGDEVIVPGYTFIATISTVVLSRAIPVLAEINESLTMDPNCLEALITPRTKAIIPVHMLGNPCDMDAIMKIAKKHNLYVIEDCCQAVGGTYKGRKLGTIGDIGAMSLNCFKTLSTGDGGCVITNNEELYFRAYGFHDQGHFPSRSGVEIGNRSLIGMNFRMNELTGAVALAQARKLKQILTMLHEKKKKVKSALNPRGLYNYRVINDEQGECATLLTLIFNTKELADRFCEAVGGKTIAHSGWHVYNNMEQILEKKTVTKFRCPYDCKEYAREMTYHKHMLLQTDDILDRAVNISIGVVDGGLGAGFGINILSSDEEIAETVGKIQSVLDRLA